MLDHLYSPQMSDIFVRLLNFNKSVFTSKSPGDSLVDSSEVVNKSDDKTENSTDAKAAFSVNAAHEIRSCTIFSIISRLGSDYSFDQQ